MANALGVVALATELGIAWNQIVSALAEFRGAARRFEVKYHSVDYMVVDDYAHHPTEIKATLAAAKNSGWKRVLALFQPHRYSRTKALLGEFASAFHDADEVFITEIYAASEAAMAGVTGEGVAEAVRAAGHGQVHYELDAWSPPRDGERGFCSRAISSSRSARAIFIAWRCISRSA